MKEFNSSLFRKEAVNNYLSGKNEFEDFEIKEPKYVFALWILLFVLIVLTVLFWTRFVDVKIPVYIQTFNSTNSNNDKLILKVELKKKFLSLIKKDEVLTIKSENRNFTCRFPTVLIDENSLAVEKTDEKALISFICENHILDTQKNNFDGAYIENSKTNIFSTFTGKE